MILLHPYAQKLRNGKDNPKTPPAWWWVSFLGALRAPQVVQLAVPGEAPFVPDVRVSLPQREIRALVRACEYWIAVDSFLPHLAQHEGKPGVVLWSQSDPTLWGYPGNLNLLKSRAYLRPRQFHIWEQAQYQPEAFVSPLEAVRAIQAWTRQEVAA
jgi:ADP-heptose:LPS heptosyltransferase